MPKTYAESQEINARFWDLMHTPGMEKQAADLVTDFTRTTLRERCYFDEIIEPQTVTADDLDRRLDDDAPAIIVDMEPDSPAAVTVGFGFFPNAVTIRAKRWPAYFSRIVSPRQMADESRLRTWIMDIRQVLTDNMVRDMLAEKDSRWQAASDLLLGDIDTASDYTGQIHYKEISGGISREAVPDGFKIMQQLANRLVVTTCLANTTTQIDFLKWGRDEMGGDLSEQIVKNGFGMTEFMNKRWIFTIKRNLVPDGAIRHYASKEFLGKNYTFYEPQMYIERRAFMISFMLYAEYGGGFAHAYGVTGSDHT